MTYFVRPGYEFDLAALVALRPGEPAPAVFLRRGKVATETVG